MTPAAERLALVRSARDGDAAALERLITVCQPDARRYADRHCRPSDVDDAVQEVLIIVLRRLRTLRVAEAFAGWLAAVVERECRRFGRLVGRTSQDDGAAALVPRDDAELRMDLAAALESLPAHYREIVLLRDFEELTIAEIVERLGEPAGAVKSRLHRARALVRDYLRAESMPG